MLHQQHLKYNTDITWNELFQTLGFVGYVYIHVRYGCTISCRLNGQENFFANQEKIRELFFKFLVGVLVVENYIVIFAMSVAVSETWVGQRSICDI